MTEKKWGVSVKKARELLPKTSRCSSIYWPTVLLLIAQGNVRPLNGPARTLLDSLFLNDSTPERRIIILGILIWKLLLISTGWLLFPGHKVRAGCKYGIYDVSHPSSIIKHSLQKYTARKFEKKNGKFGKLERRDFMFD